MLLCLCCSRYHDLLVSVKNSNHSLQADHAPTFINQILILPLHGGRWRCRHGHGGSTHSPQRGFQNDAIFSLQTPRGLLHRSSFDRVDEARFHTSKVLSTPSSIVEGHAAMFFCSATSSARIKALRVVEYSNPSDCVSVVVCKTIFAVLIFG